jgi:hypothetical protein
MFSTTFGRWAVVLAIFLTFPVWSESDSSTPTKRKKKKAKAETSIQVDKNTSTPMDYNVRLNPFDMFFGRIDANLDARVSDSLTFGPMLSVGFLTADSISYLSFDFGIRGNIYLFGDAISTAAYIGPYVLYNIWTTSHSGNAGTFGTFSGGAVVGFQWVTSSGLNFNFGAGGQYSLGPSTYSTSTALTINTPTQVTGFNPVIEISAGYAFK